MAIVIGHSSTSQSSNSDSTLAMLSLVSGVNDYSVYAGLFVIAFLAATLLPAQSEAVLAGLLASGAYSSSFLLIAASLGNVGGSIVNWWLGREIDRFSGRAWFPVKPERLTRIAYWYHRYGRWSLLASWLPFIGDPLTLIAGVLREPFWSFVVIVAVAKIARYLAVAAAVQVWM